MISLMAMDRRPVDCTSHQLVQPYVPGLVNTTVFGTKPEVGWGVSTYPNHVSDPGANRVYAVDQELITQRLDQNLTPQNGSCFTFPSGKEYSVSIIALPDTPVGFHILPACLDFQA